MKTLQSNINPSVANFDQLPDSAMIRPKPSAQLLGVSIATFWRLAKAKKFTLYKLTARTTAITAGDLRAFMSDKAGV